MNLIQHATYNGRPVIVAMGFDNPLQGYFMTVEPEGNEYHPDANEETGMIYSNLDDKELTTSHGFSDGIEHFKKRLCEMNIDVPPEFFAKVLSD